MGQAAFRLFKWVRGRYERSKFPTVEVVVFSATAAPSDGAHQRRVLDLRKVEFRPLIRVALLAMSLGPRLGHAENQTQNVDARGGPPQEDLRAAASVSFKEAERLRKEGGANSLMKAIDEYERAIALSQKAGDRAGEAEANYQLGLVAFSAGKPTKTIEAQQKALAYYRDTGDRRRQAEALDSMAIAYRARGDAKTTVALLEEALPLAQGIPILHARVLNDLGLAHNVLGQRQKALEYYSQALALSTNEGNRKDQAITLNNMGLVYTHLGDTDRALEHYQRSLELRRAVGDRQGEATTLNNLGLLFAALGDREKAIEEYAQSLEIRQQVHDRRGEAESLTNLGASHIKLRDYAVASEYLKRALPLRRETEDRRGEAATLANLGTASSEQGDFKTALDYYSQALALNREVRDPRGQGATLVGIGKNYLAMKKPQEAFASFQEALSMGRSSGDPHIQWSSLLGLARASRDSGEVAKAKLLAETALGITGAQRAKMASPELRSTFSQLVHELYDFYVDLLIAFAPGSSPRSAKAFETAEQARAQGLLELLGEARIDIREGVDPALLERESALTQQISTVAEQQLQLVAGAQTKNAPTPAPGALEEKLEKLASEMENIERQIRLASPRYAELAPPTAVKVADFQQKVLDSDTALLEYWLGSERSYLWILTKNSLQTYTLPKRSEIEEKVRRVYVQWSTPVGSRGKSRASSSPDAAQLSQILLGPASGLSKGQRLLIVPDGALEYLPFGALPWPGRRDPLLIRHDVVMLPSASTLSALRREETRRKTPSHQLAVFADPVFDLGDARVGSKLGSRANAPWETTLARVLRDMSGLRPDAPLPRLVFTRQEAQGIAALWPEDQRVLAMDFAAKKAAVLEASLADYRTIHFATHAFVDTRQPRLSGLVLSLVDEDGTVQDGIVRLHEIYRLKLAAALVVLSACHSGLGKQIQGEGLIGLTRGFLYAGAARVVASLWKVDDEATAKLMREFHRRMSSNELRPSAALRQAQVALRQTKLWRDPFYWAAFVLQGEPN